MADLISSSKVTPCPVCGRSKDGDCRIGAELVLCHHGSSHHPPDGLKPGDTVPGGDGQQWAFTGDTSDGRAATFTLHKPLEPPTTEPPTRGAESVWHYSGTFYVCRFPNKRIRPLSWIDGAWRWKAPEGKRPMLLSHPLAAKPDATVLVVEGEKTWDAARRLFPGLVVCCWSGGCNAIEKTNFTPLTGRKVVLWPDNDNAGRDAMKRLAQLLYGIGAASVKVVANPSDEPQGWDLADADWTPADAAAWVKANTSEAAKQQQQPQTVKTVKTVNRKESKPRKLSHTRAMACFERCIEIQAKRERNSLRRRARLLAAAKALGIAAYVNRQEIAQRVLEAKQRATGEVFQALTAADRAAMPKPVVRWLLPGLLPAGDLTIIGGRPKVGKTRLAVAMVAAVLNGDAVLELPAPAKTAPVILVTDDQGDGDTAEMLDAVGLWLHPGLTWSRSFRLTESDLDGLLNAIKANPGALVVIDSLRSVSRALQYGENDPEIGATLYDLKQAVIDAGGTLLLIHHCNKTADAVGLEALSGHSSIGGAANTVLTMHYLPGENGHPNKEAPERRLFREPRSGEGFDLVITRGAAGGFRKVSTLSQWQQQIKEAKEASKAERLSETQEEVREALLAAGDDWLTRRQVCEAVGVEWVNRGRTPEAQRITRALARLVALELVESQRAGVEATYRASREAQNEVMTLMTAMPPSDAKGSQCHHSSDDSDDSDATQSGTGRHRCHHSSDDSDDIEKPHHDREASVSSVSSPATDPMRAANEARIRELGQGADLSGWTDEQVAELLVSLEKAAQRRAAAGGIEIPDVA